MNFILKSFGKIIAFLWIIGLIISFSCFDVFGYEFDENDIKYLERMVETEAFGASVDSKINMANVALNRHKMSGEKLFNVITSPNQFYYHRTLISQETKDAIEFALNNPDTTNNSIYFISGKKRETFFGATYCFTDDSGTHYYSKHIGGN